MEIKHIFDFKIPYGINKKALLTLCKLFNKKNYIYRFGIFRLKKLDIKDKALYGEWEINWWKFFDIKKGEIK
jgi:hypothetical protein